MASLTEIFAFRNISKAIQGVKTGIPDRLPAPFGKQELVEQVFGNETTYHKFYGERRLVQRTEYGSPSRPTSQKKIGQVPLIMPSYASHVVMEQELLMRLRQVNDLMAQQKAVDFLNQTVKNHKQRYENNRLAHCTQMLAQGGYWYDANGNLLQSSGGAVQSIPLNIPSQNFGQLGGIYDLSWLNPAANIFMHIETLKQRQIQTTGRPLKHAFYGKNIPGYIYNNNSFSKYFQFNTPYLKAFTSNPGVIPNGFMDLEWHPMRDAFYETETETITQLFPNDGLTYTPEIDTDVYTRFEGSLLIPKGTLGQTYGTVEEALKNTELVHGIGGFTHMTDFPIALKMVMVDNFIDMWKSPPDLVISTVAF